MKDFTEIVVVLDKSGSMAPLKSDTVKSFNTFIKEQKEIGDNAALSLYLFDTNVSVLYEGIPIKDVKDLNEISYMPGGGTALNDAFGRAINDLGNRLSKLPEKDRPNKQVVVVMTDGEENSSKYYNVSQIKEMVTHQESKYNWQFLFLGANIDAFQTGQSYGLVANKCFNFAPTASGIANSAQANTRAINSYRTGSKLTCDYDDESKSADTLFTNNKDGN